MASTNFLLRQTGYASAGGQLKENSIHELLASGVIVSEDWEAVAEATREALMSCADTDERLARLVELGLLTEYQAARVSAGNTFGLVLGNYRVLDRLGAGGMGIVYKGEHIEMRRPVAIKVVPLTVDHDPRALPRFLAEIRILGQLHHPNIVTAIDCGKVMACDHHAGGLRYFVMEYVAGQDLENYIKSWGPLPPSKACELMHQVASALAETHKYQLVHRDIKPSNILITPEGQAKLLDFGLARQFRNRLTEPGTALGTLDFMAPEQALDATRVDIRADLHGVGGTLFWCLTGRLPFPSQGSIMEDVARRQTQPPPQARTFRPEIPAELDTVISRLLAPDPNARYDSPDAVMRALLPFLPGKSAEQPVLVTTPAVRTPAAAAAESPPGHSVLIVDDEEGVRGFCRHVLQADGHHCDEAFSGRAALVKTAAKPYDLVLLDIDMPDLSGIQVLRLLREKPTAEHMKVVMFSGRASADEMAQTLLAGADDYLTKPFSMVQLRGRIKAALRLKEAQDRADLLYRDLLGANAKLEQSVQARETSLVQARSGLVLALSKLVEQRDCETGGHLLRLQRYCRTLAEEAANAGAFPGVVDRNFVDMLWSCVPLHDIGKVALPDHILLKPGQLTPDERIIMQAHTLIGAETLAEVARQHDFATDFLQMAIEVARHHHERHDGGGYPDRLAGSDIPLSARFTAIADVYDALRARRIYKPAITHTASVELMLHGSPGQFDPALMRLFERVAERFEQIFRDLPD